MKRAEEVLTTEQLFIEAYNRFFKRIKARASEYGAKESSRTGGFNIDSYDDPILALDIFNAGLHDLLLLFLFLSSFKI